MQFTCDYDYVPVSCGDGDGDDNHIEVHIRLVHTLITTISRGYRRVIRVIIRMNIIIHEGYQGY